MITALDIAATKAVASNCVRCWDGAAGNCVETGCVMHHRRKDGGTAENVLIDIARYCLDCCGGHEFQVVACTARDCDLWAYRFGDAVVELTIDTQHTPTRALQRQPEP